MERLVGATVESFGGLHAAFNNAGILPPTAPLAEMSEADWDRIIDVDLKGCVPGRPAQPQEIAGMVLFLCPVANEAAGEQPPRLAVRWRPEYARNCAPVGEWPRRTEGKHATLPLWNATSHVD
jgi:hypothetical protein